MAQKGSGRWTKPRRTRPDDPLKIPKQKSEFYVPKLPANGYPTEFPFNKDCFRYILAEPDPFAPFRQEFDDSPDYSGKPIPGWLFRKMNPEKVLIAMHDRAPQLKVSEDRLSVTGEKGYCMVRATHGVHYGQYYYECTILEQPENGATRIGWSQDLGNLQGPTGYDQFSYSWRSRKGTIFHESKGKHFDSSGGYKSGDILGFLIDLPEDSDDSKGIGLNHKTYLPPTHKDRPLVKFKNYLYFEEKDEPNKVIKTLRPLKGSKIVCFKNGTLVGTAFENVHAGMYYPAASFYKAVTVRFNFGPDFKHPPNVTDFPSCKPISDLAEESSVAQTLSDMIYLIENEGELRLETFYGTNK